jgi:hypothetical protein
MLATPELSSATEIAVVFAPAAPALERRRQARRAAEGHVWLVNHPGQTELCCQLIDQGGGGARLRVPAGYGVAEGQRYELSERDFGAAHFLRLGALRRREVQVVRVQAAADDDDHVEVAVMVLPHS